VNIGVGLPSLPRTDHPRGVAEWATRAEARGFSTLGVLDRIVFPNYEPQIALSAAAAVTERIRLTTSILISPYRLNTALLAKQLATLDRLSAGRLVVGIGMGSREDDFTASGIEPRRRAWKLEQQIDEMRRIWAGEVRGYAGAIGPAPTRETGPELLLGGQVAVALRRAGRIGDGWISGGAPEEFRESAAQVRSAWQEVGRSGQPRMAAIANFSLGPAGLEHAEKFMHAYYNFPLDPGDQALVAAAGAASLADALLQDTATTPDAAISLVRRWEEAGCDELILLPCHDDAEQVDLLADAVGDHERSTLS
jgi:alkanesulfonate monooxygenase SsuD/methylene tetrahydromethanopterin reductase-like flavin-dependent oxidoreductase (luciferase family)